MTRSVLLDTETTGLDPALGHRVIEVAALELINDLPSGRHFHALIDPERDVPEDVVRVHGITAAALVGKPRFGDIAADLLGFLGDGSLVAHNGAFDFDFLNAEFARLALAPLPQDRLVDTLLMARNRFPGLPNSLDALCRRFAIDLSARTTHNALLDCRLLAEVYVELTGGRQRGLSLPVSVTTLTAYQPVGPRQQRPVVPSEEELAAHAAFIGTLVDPVWCTP